MTADMKMHLNALLVSENSTVVLPQPSTPLDAASSAITSSAAGASSTSVGPSAEGAQQRPLKKPRVGGALGSSVLNMPKFSLDKMSANDSAEADLAVAQFFFHSALPLWLVDNLWFKRMFKAIRPAYFPMARTKLSTTLLDYEHARVKAHVEEHLARSHSLTLSLDGWTDFLGRSLYAFMAMTPTPFFYDGIFWGAERHSADNLFAALQQYIVALSGDSKKVVALVTDTEATMKAVWDRVVAA